MLTGDDKFGFSAVASSDATNIQTSIRKEGDQIVINGHKWFDALP